MPRLRIAVLAAVCLIAVAVACSGDDSGGGASEVPQPQTQASGAPTSTSVSSARAQPSAPTPSTVPAATESNREDSLEGAYALIDSGNLDEAWIICGDAVIDAKSPEAAAAGWLCRAKISELEGDTDSYDYAVRQAELELNSASMSAPAKPAPTSTSLPAPTSAPASPPPQSAATSDASAPATVTSETEERDLKIVTLLPFDAIPAILEPEFTSAEEADSELEPQNLVLGLSINGDHRAYSIPTLSSHEIVNDTVGGKPVAVTW